MDAGDVVAVALARHAPGRAVGRTQLVLCSADRRFVVGGVRPGQVKAVARAPSLTAGNRQLLVRGRWGVVDQHLAAGLGQVAGRVVGVNGQGVLAVGHGVGVDRERLGALGTGHPVGVITRVRLTGDRVAVQRHGGLVDARIIGGAEVDRLGCAMPATVCQRPAHRSDRGGRVVFQAHRRRVQVRARLREALAGMGASRHRAAPGGAVGVDVNRARARDRDPPVGLARLAGRGSAGATPP